MHKRLTLQLTLLQLIIHYHQKGNRDHEEVEDEADLTELSDGRATHLLHHRLVSALATDGRRVAQNDQTTDQEHQGDLHERTKGERRSKEIQITNFTKGDIYVFNYTLIILPFGDLISNLTLNLVWYFCIVSPCCFDQNINNR